MGVIGDIESFAITTTSAMPSVLYTVVRSRCARCLPFLSQKTPQSTRLIQQNRTIEIAAAAFIFLVARVIFFFALSYFFLVLLRAIEKASSSTKQDSKQDPNIEEPPTFELDGEPNCRAMPEKL